VFCAIDYYYNKNTISVEIVDIILDKFIQDFLNEENLLDNDLFITFMTKLHFEKIDKKIKIFGEKWGNYVKISYPKSEELEISAFSDLLLNNISFFHEKVFPNVDIQGIENQLQVTALLEGKYFRYLSKKNFYRDLKFNFE
jgi:hypothetical protein